MNRWQSKFFKLRHSIFILVICTDEYVSPYFLGFQLQTCLFVFSSKSQLLVLWDLLRGMNFWYSIPDRQINLGLNEAVKKW